VCVDGSCLLVLDALIAHEREGAHAPPAADAEVQRTIAQARTP
jgi:hypothetical protein